MILFQVPAIYDFNYGISASNGDVKSAQESRNGDKTVGQYTVNDPDGTVRVVKYTVDGDSGFVVNILFTLFIFEFFFIFILLSAQMPVKSFV